MDYQAFKDWIIRKGYSIISTTKHHKIVDKNGKFIDHFAISHKTGGKRFIKPGYISRIRRKIGP
jgi:hypothetical protein